MDGPLASSPGVVDPASFLKHDLHCRRCGYNLRGLREDGACPECGSAVGLSTHGDLLCFADPNWVETVAGGVRLILWGVLFSIVGGCAGGGIGVAIGKPVLVQVLPALASIVSFFGVWWLTAEDPSRVGEDRFARARRLTRVALMLAVAVSGLSIFVNSGVFPPEIQTVIAVVTGLLGFLASLGEFFKFLYLEHLSSRIPNDLLVRRAKMLRWGLTVSSGLAAVLGLVSALVFGMIGSAVMPGASLPPSWFVMLAITGVCFVVCMIFAILSIIYYFTFSRSIREQAVLARQTWMAVRPQDRPS